MEYLPFKLSSTVDLTELYQQESRSRVDTPDIYNFFACYTVKKKFKNFTVIDRTSSSIL